MSLPDYKAYQAHVGITNPEMTEELQKVFPSYNKVCGTYVNNPEKYGVCLLGVFSAQPPPCAPLSRGASSASPKSHSTSLLPRTKSPYAETPPSRHAARHGSRLRPLCPQCTPGLG